MLKINWSHIDKIYILINSSDYKFELYLSPHDALSTLIVAAVSNERQVTLT